MVSNFMVSCKSTTCIKLRAERKAGEILKETELHKGGRPKETGISPHTGFQPNTPPFVVKLWYQNTTTKERYKHTTLKR